MDKKLKTIVLIDDDTSVNYYHEIILKKADVAEMIIKFDHAKDALAYLANQDNGVYPKPELIFLDINMPVMDGWGFLEEFNKLDQGQTSGVAIIMLTSSLNQGDRKRAMAMDNVFDFINKPLRLEMLNETIERYFVNSNTCCQ